MKDLWCVKTVWVPVSVSETQKRFGLREKRIFDMLASIIFALRHIQYNSLFNGPWFRRRIKNCSSSRLPAMLRTKARLVTRSDYLLYVTKVLLDVRENGFLFFLFCGKFKCQHMSQHWLITPLMSCAVLQVAFKYWARSVLILINDCVNTSYEGILLQHLQNP